MYNPNEPSGDTHIQSILDMASNLPHNQSSRNDQYRERSDLDRSKSKRSHLLINTPSTSQHDNRSSYANRGSQNDRDQKRDKVSRFDNRMEDNWNNEPMKRGYQERSSEFPSKRRSRWSENINRDDGNEYSRENQPNASRGTSRNNDNQRDRSRFSDNNVSYDRPMGSNISGGQRMHDRNFAEIGYNQGFSNTGSYSEKVC